MKKQALISCSDKSGVVEFAKALTELGYHILSTGGTAKLIAQAGIPVQEVADYTGFPEMLDGRVKTLNPKIHAGILARRPVAEHMEALKQFEIDPIDIVAVNLYPFEQAIANPNCTTIITLMALFPLHQRFGLKTVIASSYQAVSGSGQHGIAELETQVRAVVDGHPVVKNVYPHQIAFNLLPQIDSFTENGYTKEELKMLNEGRKILSLPELKVTCTCVRVPVYRSHSISVTAQFEKPVDLETARSAYEGKPGVALMDNPAEGVWPTPLDSTNGDTCYVGRMRMDMAIDNALTLWVVGDQVRKGAALNAVQIAELLVNR